MVLGRRDGGISDSTLYLVPLLTLSLVTSANPDTVGTRLYGTCPCPITIGIYMYMNFWSKKGMWKRLLNWEQL